MEAPAPANGEPAAAAAAAAADATSLDTLPEDNATYKRKEYWDQRFEKEEAYEWLVSHVDVKGLLAEYLPTPPATGLRILVVGCGNSDFSAHLLADLQARGVQTPVVVSLDYSDVVIAKMQAKYEGTPGLEWVVQDMRTLPARFEAGSFDLVIDKAGTDGA